MDRSRAPQPSLSGGGPPGGGSLSNLAPHSRRLKSLAIRAPLKSAQHEQRLQQRLCMHMERAWLYVLRHMQAGLCAASAAAVVHA